MIDAVVDRLHRCIVDELRERGHEQARPLRVADLYEDIVPYRVVRARLGVELNADYEHALLRLLAGERELLRLDDDDARQEMERELARPYPAVSMFRRFADSHVWARLDQPPAGPPAGPPADATAVALAPPPRPPEREPPTVRTAEEEAPEPPPPARVTCVFCGESLPATRDVRFCPHCGRDQELRPCGHCHETLEPGWRYCVRCGHGAPDG